MTLPFSHDAFLDVFGAYNSLLWPAAVVLWLVTAALALVWMRGGQVRGRWVFAVLAVHWAWSGIAYHWLFFRHINPAATLFGAGFVLQAVLFACLALTSRAYFKVGRGVRGILAGALVLYGLAYPLVGLAFGLRFPRVPLFAVPCPTTLVTAGWLLAGVGVPRLTTIMPIAWAIVASSAAVALGVSADTPLAVAAVLLGLDMVVPNALGSRVTPPLGYAAEDSGP